jgi:hypothetical protein
MNILSDHPKITSAALQQILLKADFARAIENCYCLGYRVTTACATGLDGNFVRTGGRPLFSIRPPA